MATIWGWHLFFWKGHRYQLQLDKVHTYEWDSGICKTLSVVHVASQSCCHPWNWLVQHKCPSASMVTIIRKYRTRVCVCRVYTSHGYCLKGASIQINRVWLVKGLRLVLSAEVCYHHLPSSRGCISQIWDAVKGVETMPPLLSWCHTLRCDLLTCVCANVIGYFPLISCW